MLLSRRHRQRRFSRLKTHICKYNSEYFPIDSSTTSATYITKVLCYAVSFDIYTLILLTNLIEVLLTLILAPILILSEMNIINIRTNTFPQYFLLCNAIHSAVLAVFVCVSVHHARVVLKWLQISKDFFLALVASSFQLPMLHIPGTPKK